MLKWGDSIPSSDLPVIPCISAAHANPSLVPTAPQAANVNYTFMQGNSQETDSCVNYTSMINLVSYKDS